MSNERKRDGETMLSEVAGDATTFTGPESQPSPLERRLPETVGRYRVVRLVGEGGMGAVYEAEQDQPRRIVALKVIKPGWTSPELLRRFELESQALGRLQHPGIAQIYEAGAADTGFGPQPYFAMEFIRGKTLKEYSAAHQLSTRQRLELMARICDAVEHAHERGLIHRDLKPGNIIVDQTGQPKILDFGVARLTGSDVQATRQTDLGQLVGTLAYMSPEQVMADTLELDKRSDVYALGVVLYELLAGRLPYTFDNNLQAVQTILEEDPTRLSSISRDYRGDIETIAGKALEKDKTRRYASAAALADDIRRHLDDEPIAARPASTSYQLQKFARRHRALVGAVIAVFAALVTGTLLATWQAVRARRAERAALEAQQTAEAVNDFLQNDLLAQASADNQATPNTNPDPDLKVRTALDRAAAKIEGKFSSQHMVEASIRQTIGVTYRDLGLFPQAQQQLEKVVTARSRALGDAHPDTLEAMSVLADVYSSQSKFTQAEPLLLRAAAIAARLWGEKEPQRLSLMTNLGLLYWREGKYAEAESILVKVLDGQRSTTPEDDTRSSDAMNALGLVYQNEAKYAEAERLYTRALQLRQRVSGEQHPASLALMNNLAQVYERVGKYPDAEALLEKALAIRRRVSGDEHPDTLSNMNNLGLVYRNEAKYQQAETILSQALEIRRRVIGAEHPNTLLTMNNLALTYSDEGKGPEAEALLAETLSIRRSVSGPEHPDTLLAVNNLSMEYFTEKKYEQAEALLANAPETARRVSGEDHPLAVALTESLGRVLEAKENYARAEALFEKVLASRRRQAGPEHLTTLRAAYFLGRIRFRQQRYASAETILRDAMASYLKTQPDHWERYRCEGMLGAILAAEKQYDNAEQMLLSAYEGMNQRMATIPASWRNAVEDARNSIVKLYEAWGKPQRALEWKAKTALRPR
jgi:tetratricopeptide (TPR) repeat protein